MGWKNVDTVIPGRLYLGNIHAARSPRSITERRITHIVSVCNDAIPAEIPESGIAHLRVPVEDVDFADLLIWLPTACQFIEQAIAAGGVVLVHCNQGLTRSATVVAAYLMCTRRIDATQAMSAVRQGLFLPCCPSPVSDGSYLTAREQVWFNAGFHEQLFLFELCRYQPSPACPYYVGWRQKLAAHLAGQT
ncbi:protein-tyrosine phosphatase-like protein [Boletus reticuloceps]|uniref:Protein-tyrosine phosphatase-like protein n=1 Tax=Boletus reticuloceps TaxID=495285 RepID=A0A8I3ADU0_9AGAM|nr:protein-tyrosine phosphatase-like protein [Boletus reticuloceps]